MVSPAAETSKKAQIAERITTAKANSANKVIG